MLRLNGMYDSMMRISSGVMNPSPSKSYLLKKIFVRIYWHEFGIPWLNLYIHLHIESKPHFLAKIPNENIGEVLDKGLHCHVFVLLFLLDGLFCHGFGHGIHSGGGTASVHIVVVGEHYVQAVINDSRKLCVLNKRHLVNMLGLVAAHQEVFVEVAEVRHQLIPDKFSIQVCVVVF